MPDQEMRAVLWSCHLHNFQPVSVPQATVLQVEIERFPPRVSATGYRTAGGNRKATQPGITLEPKWNKGSSAIPATMTCEPISLHHLDGYKKYVLSCLVPPPILPELKRHQFSLTGGEVTTHG